MKVDPIRHALGVGRFQFPVEASQATALAAANFELNRAAIERVWPRTILCLPDTLPELEWLYARDGTLSARHCDGQWIGDVSVPQKAAERLFARLTVAGTTAVMLAPTHAAQVRVALDRIQPHQALIVVIPTEQTAGAILACGDFSSELTAGRLWLACGPDWADELKTLLEGNEGLPAPTMMIRVPGLNTYIVDSIQKPCESILATHAQTQKQLVSMIHGKPRAPSTPPASVLVATQTFSLWNDGPALLGDLAKSLGCAAVVCDTSHPATASVLKFARLAEACDAILTANIGRADLPALVADSVPWITWITTPRLPAYSPAATADRLVLADASWTQRAIAAGWPATQIEAGAEPIVTQAAHGSVAIIVDCEPIVIPKSIEEMSSHRLVWERIEQELTRDPLASRETPADYVMRCADRMGVPRESLPVDVIVNHLVMPLFARQLAKHLKSRGVSFAIWGKGWNAIPEIADLWRGEIRGLHTFNEAIAETTALLDVWPNGHRAYRCGRPFIPAWGRSWNELMKAIQSPAQAARPAVVASPFSPTVLTRLS